MAELTDWVRRIAAAQDPRVSQTTPVVRLLTHPLPTRPFPVAEAEVFLCAGVAVRRHPAGTDPHGLAERLAVLREPDLEPLWVQPLGYRPLTLPDGRLATVWPRVSVLSTLDKPPWQEAGRLLARLHRAGWVHGDFHLGHLAHTALRRSWKLVDPDRLATGSGVSDLGLPAAFHAAGLLEPDAWERLLTAYRASGGPAVPAGGDPWPALASAAREAALSAAARLPDRAEAQPTIRALVAVAQGPVSLAD